MNFTRIYNPFIFLFSELLITSFKTRHLSSYPVFPTAISVVPLQSLILCLDAKFKVLHMKNLPKEV